MRKEVRGFTLVELTFAIAVVSTVAAVVVPSLARERQSANEAAASGGLKTLVEAQAEFHEATGSYADSLSTLHAAGYIDDALGTGVKSGYAFNMLAGGGEIPTDTWTGWGNPEEPQRTGVRSFYIDETGILRSPCRPGQQVVIDPVILARSCDPDGSPSSASELPDDFEAIVAVEELDSLSSGQALALAREKLRDPAYLASVFASLDMNADGRLTFAEALEFRFSPGSPIGGSPGPAFGLGSSPAAILQRYQQRLAERLRLGIAHEEELPAVQLGCLTGFPETLLDQAAGAGPRASLDILQALLRDLDVQPPPIGDMPGDAPENQRRKTRLLRSADGMVSLLRFGKLAELRSDLLGLRDRADGRPRPVDWIAGAAAADVVARVDATLALVAPSLGRAGQFQFTWRDAAVLAWDRFGDTRSWRKARAKEVVP